MAIDLDNSMAAIDTPKINDTSSPESAESAYDAKPTPAATSHAKSN